ncbi:hypothetical protein NK214_12020 [Chromobacterium sp. S0633]|uniref:hypothetical protein n=1 Tax=Chromobacterium sp. S0633 TaxID=2957805 RepID=UPI00209F1852|nr:hypothetical protein [Chromobacterium sp. S0633]MCP1290916.1 hypothetical protein [Chromobacterium sp. S0633]
MKSKLAELLVTQYGKPAEKQRKTVVSEETLARPFGSHKDAFYGLLVPVTNPRR